jgi:hypothetical protein
LVTHKTSTRPREREMRSLVRSIGLAAGVLVLAGVQNARAQIVDTVEFTTTFPFTVGNATMPAGHYSIRQDDDNGQVLELIGDHSSVLFETISTTAPTPAPKTEVVFQRRGDTYVLKTIWLAGETTGAETMAAEGERHAAKHAGAASQQRVDARKKGRAASGQ